jgi:hypothetical protein
LQGSCYEIAPNEIPETSAEKDRPHHADKADVERILQCKGINYGCTHARHDAKHKPKDKIYD